MIPTDEQPYPLPDGWQWVTIKDIADVKGGKRLPKGKNLVDYKTRYPYIRVTDFFNNSIKADELKYLEEDVYNSIKRYTISSKDVYISIAGSIGKVGTIPLDLDGANLTENAAKITRLRGVNQSFLMWFLTSDFAQGQIKDLTKSTTQPKLALFRIEKIPIPLPTLDEQQRIVSLLDELFADLDEAKALAQSVVDGSKLRRAAILHKAFTGELSRLWRDEHGTTLDGWQRCLLGDVLISSKQKTTDFSSSDLKYVGLENMEKDGGQISFQAADDVRSTKNVFCVGDLLYGKLRPYLNKHGVAAFDGVCSTDILVFKASEQAEIEFVNYFLSLPKFIEYAVANSKGINLPRVSEKVILRAEIFLPPPEEQKEIVRLLDDLLGREQQAKELATKTLERTELMKKSILARAFCGELGINKNLRDI